MGLLAFDLVDQSKQIATIKVIGIGGAGGNAINRMIEDNLTGVEFYAMNTDKQVLDQNKAPHRIQIGEKATGGLGAGGNPEIGEKAVEENKDLIIEALCDTDMVFIACGMGGGTGTGAAPAVAQIAKDCKALTVGIITTPFLFEGKIRNEKARKGIEALAEFVDTMIIVPNEKLLSLVPRNMPVEDAFRVADETLMHATKGISDVINVPGLINVDFADVKSIMSDMGDALMGSGVATGENRAQEAAEKAISSPLIDNASIGGAAGVLVNITGGKDLTLNDISEATMIIHNAAGDNANIIFGAVIDPKLTDELRVTVVATGFHKSTSKKRGYPELSDMAIDSSFVAGNGDIPLIRKLESEPLEQIWSDVFTQESDVPFNADAALNIPTFVRNQAGE
ncbi:cell division protein FtsZ [candidate division KSB1 bacterium]|nr:cell division protein FtsZ [candidate division KSB1 bacterium]